jgi:alpha-tubulin suppressor-like RCC1 family protein
MELLIELFSKEKKEKIYRPIIFKQSIKHINCGINGTLMLTHNKKVYGMGSNKYGQLGLGEINHVNSFTEIKLPYNEHPKKLITSHNYSFIITEKGYSFVFGLNNYGQLGLGHFNNVKTPKLIKIRGVKRVFLFHNQTFMTIRNKLLVCGRNIHGNLGVNEKYNSINRFTEVKFPNYEIDLIFCSGKTTFIICKNNKYFYETWSCGSNYCGQLGLGSKINETLEFLKINFPMNQFVHTIFAFEKYTIFWTCRHNIYVCGVNDKGQIGLGKDRLTMFSIIRLQPNGYLREGETMSTEQKIINVNVINNYTTFDTDIGNTYHFGQESGTDIIYDPILKNNIHEKKTKDRAIFNPPIKKFADEAIFNPPIKKFDIISL